MSTTIHDICKGIPVVEKGKRGPDPIKARKGQLASVADGLTPRRPPPQEGLHTFTPEELLTLIVPVIELNGRVLGYQRPFARPHARKIARAMTKGDPMPEINVAIDGHGAMYSVDGQHRAVGAVIARKEIDGIVKRMTKDEQRALFAGQRKAKPVDRNVLILAGKGPYDRYIQDACATNGHAWSSIVSANPHSKTRISPYAMFGLLAHHIGNSSQTVLNPAMEERWDETLADGLAPLIACFGDKQTNPPAFKPGGLRGIGLASMYVFRRNERLQDDDRERWIEHMPKFPWERFLHVRSSHDYSFHLVNHWNKRLSGARKVRID